jgi:regulation of enolase protein 1 (concanavalin A-like superfamily)
MPPLGRNLVDTDAVSALAEWINTYAPGPLPPPWQHQDVGAVGIAGHASFMTNLGIFSVAGSGTDVWGQADEFHYAYQNVSGNCEIIARVLSITDTDPWARAGVMIRAGTGAGASNVFMAVTTQNGLDFQWRQTGNGESSYVQGPYLTAPLWVRLTRTNNSFRGSYSSDGANWTQLGSAVSINMPASVSAGLAVAAVNNGALNTSTFDSVRINSAATLDSDADGMPDSFEVAHEFNVNNSADAGQDADLDGMTNLQEYWAGTNPRNAASVLRITRINRLGSNLVLSFLSGTGRMYAIERTTTLPASWQLLTNVGPFTNGSTTLTNTGGAASSNGFYRLRTN